MYFDKFKYNYEEIEEYKVSLDDNSIDIFLVDEDIILLKNMQLELEKYGYTSQTVENFNNIIDEILFSNPKLIIMDINLKYKSSLDIYNEIKKVLIVPIIFMISKNNGIEIISNINKIKENYILKPFFMKDLVKKVQEVLKKFYLHDLANNREILEMEECILNISEKMIRKNDKIIKLTSEEFDILMIIISNSGKIINKKYIVDSFLEKGIFIDEKRVELVINKIINKLKSIGLDNFIKIIKGRGYFIEEF